MHSVLFKENAPPPLEIRLRNSKKGEGRARNPIAEQTTYEVSSSENMVYFQGDSFPLISTAQFKAGRLKEFVHNWVKLTSDAFVLDTVQHCHIELTQGASCHQHTVRAQRFNITEEIIITSGRMAIVLATFTYSSREV